MTHLATTTGIIILFVAISIVINRVTLKTIGLKPTWRQVLSITGTIFTVQFVLALPSLINPKTSLGGVLGLVSIVSSIVLWCIFLKRFFHARLAKSLLGVVLFYALTALTVIAIIALVHFVPKLFGA